MTQDNIYTIISRFLAGEATPTDISELNDWLAQDENNVRRLNQMQKFWETPVETTAPETSFEKFFARIEAPKINPERSSRKFYRITPVAAAASIALFVTISLSMLFLGKSHRTPVEYYTIACKSGVERLVLPDSSVVYLNEASRVTYTNSYAEERRVRIEGEAYFDVVKGRGTFRVDMNDDTSIEVLGTKFNVAAFAEKNSVIATLEEGAIKFIGGDREILLEPDQQLVYDRATLKCQVSDVDASIYTAWKEPVYKYMSITMTELCHELERLYGLDICLNPNIGNIRVSGSFKRKDNIETILGVMEKRMQFQWTRNGDHIQIE